MSEPIRNEVELDEIAREAEENLYYGNALGRKAQNVRVILEVLSRVTENAEKEKAEAVGRIAKDAALTLFHPFSYENTLTNTEIIAEAIYKALGKPEPEVSAGNVSTQKALPVEAKE